MLPRPPPAPALPPNLPPRARRALGKALPLLGLAVWLGVGVPAARAQTERMLDDVTSLPAVLVRGDRMEDLGLRLSVQVGIPTSNNRLSIAEVFPHTAAAKAGLRPGECIEKIDGKAVGIATLLSLGFKPQKLQQRLWDELARGKPQVSVTLEVRAPAAKTTRTVTLTLPSKPPRWGGEKWSAPEGRAPAVVREAGPLAALAREVLDNGIWSGSYDQPGFEWRIVQPAGGHRIWVRQQGGATEIRLEHFSPDTGHGEFTTSPTGAMETARWSPPPKQKGAVLSPEELRARFEAELDFWLHKVGRVTGRWPFEALSGETAVLSSVSSPRNFLAPAARPAGGGAAGQATAARAAAFLQLPVASAEQRALFADALGKIGLDAEGWAYTETVRSPEGGAVTTVRYDPSKPPGERSTLLQVDGKPPKPAALQAWRAEHRDPLPGLGELPPLASLVDLGDVRVVAEETAAVVFELPVRSEHAEFPADKFQARFRVNRAARAYEDFSVSLREPQRVTGVARVVEAGIEVRFQTRDPALAPQPAWLRMGGGVRVLGIKVARALEITRRDFTRVAPSDPAAAAPATAP